MVNTIKVSLSTTLIKYLTELSTKPITKNIFRSLPFALVLFLAGCSVVDIAQPVSQPEASVVVQNPNTIVPEKSLVEPVIPFASETLYDLLVAEVGGQRQRYDLALGNYLKQAHQTRDAGVAERAYQIAAFVGARQAALDATLLWVELKPESIAAHNAAALELVYAREFARAFTLMEKQLVLGGDAAFDVLASAVGAHDQSGQALRSSLIVRLGKLAQSRPDNRMINLSRAILLQQAGEYEEALVLAMQLSAQDRDFIPALMVQGRALNRLKRYEEAQRLLTEALQRHPDKHRLRLLLAQVLVHSDQLALARQQFTALLQRAPDDGEIVLSLALIALENDMLHEARQYFQTLLTLGEKRNTAHYYLGRVHEKQQQFDKAQEAFLQVGPGKEFMAAQVALSQMLVKQGKLDEALELIASARSRNPSRIEPLFLLEGELLVSHNLFEKGLALYNRALKAVPQSINLMYSRAMIHDSLNDLAGMEGDLRTILKAEPDNIAALNALGYILADQTDRYEEAYALILRAYELDQEDPAIMDSMGWVQFRLGNVEQAEKYLRMAYEQLPDAEIASHLGEILWVKGDHSAARAVWMEAVEKEPDNPTLKETMKRLLPLHPETVSTVE